MCEVDLFLMSLEVDLGATAFSLLRDVALKAFISLIVLTSICLEMLFFKALFVLLTLS